MGPKPVSLKELAERLGLSPATVSLVINRSPVADSIPQETKERVFAAARNTSTVQTFLPAPCAPGAVLPSGLLFPKSATATRHRS